MSITDSSSVLVLGAGVSTPFGLSPGGDMITAVSNAIKKEINKIYDEDDVFKTGLKQKIRASVSGIPGFTRFPIHGTIARTHWDQTKNDFDITKLNIDLEKIRILGEFLDGQTSETIDDFIVENSSYALITKIGIATLFMQSCYKFDNHGKIVRPFFNRHFRDNSGILHRNWIHLLINIIRHGIRSGAVSQDNKIQIITFNYDKILEFVLEKQFSNTEASYPHYSEYINIIHVHGECGDLNNDVRVPIAEINLAWANGIHVVNEEYVPEGILAQRRKAKKIIKTAKELYICGFSFSGPNCRLLGLDSLAEEAGNRLISFCNYDGNIGISKTVEKYRIHDPMGAKSTNIEEAKGSSNKPLGVSDWLKLGYLGESPG